MRRTHLCTRCQTIKRNQFEILFHICFLPYQNLKYCENFYDNAVRLLAGFISKLLFLLYEVHVFKMLETTEKTNHKSKASPKPILPHYHILFCPSTLTLWKLSSLSLLNTIQIAVKATSGLWWLGIFTHVIIIISQVSATLGPQALSALILKLERRG